MKDLFAIPLFHESVIDSGSDLNNRIIASIEAAYNEKKHLDNGTENGRRMRCSSFFNTEGKYIPPNQIMDAVDGWDELKTTINHSARLFIDAIAGQVNSPGGRPLVQQEVFEPEAWYHVYETEDTLQYHSHSKWFISGVYFPKISNYQQPIHFKSPYHHMIEQWWGGDYNRTGNFSSAERWQTQTYIVPKAGDLLLWPSFLEHGVPRSADVGWPFNTAYQNVRDREWLSNKDDELRISISVNYFRPDKIKPEDYYQKQFGDNNGKLS